MKKAILAFVFVLAGTAISFAQCDKTATFKSSVTNYLNDKGEIERTNDEETTVTVSKTAVVITPGDHTMEGKVTNFVCNWTVPFKEGKTSFNTVLDNDGHEMHATIVIEGIGGKVTLTFTADEMPGRKIQVVATKFE